MSDFTKEAVAQQVRERLKGLQPGGVTLAVVEERIHKVDDWWRVPVRPSAWPRRMAEYYEALADIETDLHEHGHLNILIATGEPEESPQEVAPAGTA